jgi:hypothetical protein
MPPDREPAPKRRPAVDPRFEPPSVERLDLAKLLERPAAEPLRRVPVQRTSSLMPVVLVVLVAAAGIGGWQLYASRRAASVDAAAADAASVSGASLDAPDGDGAQVLLMISTTPKDAVIFVDDVRATVNPMSVPRSDRPVQVRVEASGWEPREVAVEADRSRRVEVALQRSRR